MISDPTLNQEAWLFPSKPSVYPIHQYLKDNKNTIDWHKKKRKVHAGDIVFIYESMPIQAITLVGFITKVNEETFTIKMTGELTAEIIPYKNLAPIFEVLGTLQGPRKVSAKNTTAWLRFFQENNILQ
jgi:hypothetical protein